MPVTRSLRLTLTLLAVGLATGCRVSSHENGRNKNVDIGTPFGSMHVKTNGAANLAGLGITLYPGAAPYEEKDHGGSADVNMSFGDFHLGVKAASFLSHDSEEQVLAFYKKDLARYGDVLECQGKAATGKVKRTSQGLSCDEDDDSAQGRVHAGSGPELRAGSPQHQHIVAVESKDGGTKIGLVALDLPGHLGHRRDSEAE